MIPILAITLASCAEPPEPHRPNITGVAHAAFFTENLDHTRDFFKEYLGYGEPIVVTNDDGSTAFTVIKINDRQFVELFPERSPKTNRLYHFALETDDAEAMRKYLEYNGFEVPSSTSTGHTGNDSFFVTDPNGVICEIVQYKPESMTTGNIGQDMPDTRISPRMSHVGFMTEDVDKALDFYVNVLGFEEVWRGGSNPNKVKWVHLRVPEGTETIELMLYEEDPTWDRMGTMNHICLEAEDVFQSKAILEKRSYPDACRPFTEPVTGINKKRQINYYNIDGTRVEIMDRETVDGIPAPSSTAPPMRYTPKESR